MTYQGWSNHATWVVALWLDNTYSAYHEFTVILKNKNFNNKQKASVLKKWVYDIYISQIDKDLNNRGYLWGTGIRGDLWDTESLKDVNWPEIIQTNMHEYIK